MSFQRNHLILAAASAVVLIGVWLLPIDVAPGGEFNGKLFTASSWQVTISGQGHLQSLLSERASGVVSRYAMQSVERGEASDFVLTQGLRNGSRVEAGDTVATLFETGLDQRRVAQLSEVAVATREQAAAEAGEKETLIGEAHVRLERIESLITLQERIVKRIRQLHERALVSDTDLDAAEAQLAKLIGDAAVVRAQLSVLESGARPADVSLARARVDAARRQLEALNRRRARTAIVSPISGVISRSMSDSVLVSVTDNSSWIVLVPIPLTARYDVVAGDSVLVGFPRATPTTAGFVSAVDQRIQHVGVIPVLLAVVSLDTAPPEALEGLPVKVYEMEAPIRLREYLTIKLREWVPWQSWFGLEERV